MVYPKFWADDYTLIYTHHQELMKSVGGLAGGVMAAACHCNPAMKVMIQPFVSNSHLLCVTFKVLLQSSLLQTCRYVDLMKCDHCKDNMQREICKSRVATLLLPVFLF
jgi:hypothetical protein